MTSLSRSNTCEYKFKEKKVLKPAKPTSNVGNSKEGTITDKNNKTPCYLVTRSHFSPESPIDGSTPSPRNSLVLIPLPLSIPPIVTVGPSASHLNELHGHNTKQITISNYNYQSTAESHKWLKELADGNQ